MPARGEPSAPKFDSNQPRELRRYFADLALHFAQSHIADDQQRKVYACRYVNIDTADLWESLGEFSNLDESYSAFIRAIHRLYPGSEGQRQWLVADMEKLVEARCRIEIRTLGDFGDYLRQFIAITTFLRHQKRLSDIEEGQHFMRGFSPDFFNRVLQRLWLKLPDHLPDDPYCLKDISDAAQFILYGTATSVSITTNQRSHPIALASPSSDFADKNVTKSRLLSHPLSRPAQSHALFMHTRQPSSETPLCNFCGRPNHFIGQCSDAVEYIRAGKCNRNFEGKITLPTGLFISSDIPGRFLKFRIDEWHCRNPGHLSAPSATSFTFENASNPLAPPWDRCTSLPSHSINTPTVKTSTLSLSDTNQARASERERERLQIRPRFAPVTPPARPSRRFAAGERTVSPAPGLPMLGRKTSTPSLSDANRTRASERELERLQIRPRVTPVTLPTHPSRRFVTGERTVSPTPGLPMLGRQTLNPSLSDANRIRAIERELERLRSHTRVAPVTSPARPNRSFVTEDHVESPVPISGRETSELSLAVPPQSPAPIPNSFNWTSAHCSSEDRRQSRLQ